MLTIEPEGLAEEIEGHFDSYVAKVASDGDAVIVTERIPAGMYYPEDFERFEKDVKQFVFEYTQSWVVEGTSMNRIEGQSRAVLRCEDGD